MLLRNVLDYVEQMRLPRHAIPSRVQRPKSLSPLLVRCTRSSSFAQSPQPPIRRLSWTERAYMREYRNTIIRLFAKVQILSRLFYQKSYFVCQTRFWFE